MRIRTSAALFTTAMILVGSAYLSATQSSATSNSPQPKSAQTTPAPAGSSESDAPTKKLGVFVGKWETEGSFTSGQKTHTTLECRWSPQGSYLVCDQLVRMGAADQRQFTVYSYNSKAGNYSFTTIADPGAKPTTGGITIKGNLWTYDDSSFTANGKTMMFRTTNEFTDPKTEIFKMATSEDNGATWKIALQGVARKVGD